MPVYPEIFDGPGRNHTKDAKGNPVITTKKYIVIHNTSNTRLASARDEASYAKNRTDGVSSHYYVDKTRVLQSLDTDWRAQHVGSKAGNDGGISYELTGLNGFTRDKWLSDIAWNKLADSIARDCRHHNIGVRTLRIVDMRSGNVTGIVTHDQCRQAWGGTDHTDPGPNFPMDHLIALVEARINPPVPTPPPTPAPDPAPVPDPVPVPVPDPAPVPSPVPVPPPVPVPATTWVDRIMAWLRRLFGGR